MNQAYIKSVSTYLPERILKNEELAALYPEWPADRIYEKTGIKTRHISGHNQTASDMAVEAANKLFVEHKIDRHKVDYLIFCTQAPDYILPSSACIIQSRLHLEKSIGALDINLGCSGYVYCLSLAKGLIASESAKNVLVLTSDTYSKFINQYDKSVRTLFGDGASATLVSTEGFAKLGSFVFGTDGSGADKLIVEAGLCRLPKSGETALEKMDSSGNIRSKENLYMNGAEVMSFSLKEVPNAIENLLDNSGYKREDIKCFVLHQANKFMLDSLRKKLNISEEKLPFLAEDEGNTVSSTIPFAFEKILGSKEFAAGDVCMFVGFGVGYSWAACNLHYK